MTNSITARQAFSWAEQLTAQPDYQGLTYQLLHILENLSGIERAIAYEIYGNKHTRTGEASSTNEHLIRRFPLDFAQEELNPPCATLLDNLDDLTDVSANRKNEAGLPTQTVLSIKDVCGPNRAIWLQGVFDRELMELLGHLRSLYRNQLFLHDSKERDVLTKLPNRQSFDARLMQVCEYYRDHRIHDKSRQKSSWIAILDIDHFKTVNDTFGHLYGDEVLLIFSQLMEKHFRYNDFLFRFGGEEFIVILNLVDQYDAQSVFERFRITVAEQIFPTVGKVTVSIGLTHIESEAIPSTLLDRADKALYLAKQSGRNQVVLYENAGLLSSDHPTNIELF